MSAPDLSWIDLQVNGAFGLDFNSDDWSFEFADQLVQRMIAMGCAGFLPTVITDQSDRIIHRLKRISSWIEESPVAEKVALGIHLEGPFLSEKPGYVGAHPVDCVMEADVDLAKRFMEAANGHLRMVTLAPEKDPGAKLTSLFVNAGIVVSAGHTDTPLETLRRTIDAGLSMFTHLGNACPRTLDRHDNILNRVFACRDQLVISFIADGHHVPFFALKNYLDLLPDSNIVIVSDAMSAAGMTAGTYHLAGQVVHVEKDGAAWCEDRTHFAGSATLMPKMAELLSTANIATNRQLQQWMLENPRRKLGLD